MSEAHYGNDESLDKFCHLISQWKCVRLILASTL